MGKTWTWDLGTVQFSLNTGCAGLGVCSFFQLPFNLEQVRMTRFVCCTVVKLRLLLRSTMLYIVILCLLFNDVQRKLCNDQGRCRD